MKIIDKAIAHEKEMRERYSTDISRSIKNATVYGPEEWSRRELKDCNTKIVLVDADSVSCLFNEPLVGKTAVLNYASYTSPGGGYMRGMVTQEEDLCHKSNLYSILSSYELSTYYRWNKQHKNKCLYEDRALYVPSVVFEHGEKSKRADVITCAAPNYSSAKQYHNVTQKENEEAMISRIKFVINIAYHNNVETLVAGAWGCGVFGQDASFVAKALIEQSRCLKLVYFAIPDSSSYNFKAFEELF